MNKTIPFNNIEDLSNFLDKEENKESDVLEFKEQINHIEKSDIKNFIDTYFEFNILKSIYAMANTNGGTILIGISDDKNIIGIKESEVKNLTKKINDIHDVKTRINDLKLENGRVVLKIDLPCAFSANFKVTF